MEPHGVDHFDATFVRDLMWARRFREQLAELPSTDQESGPQEN